MTEWRGWLQVINLRIHSRNVEIYWWWTWRDTFLLGRRESGRNWQPIYKLGHGFKSHLRWDLKMAFKGNDEQMGVNGVMVPHSFPRPRNARHCLQSKRIDKTWIRRETGLCTCASISLWPSSQTIRGAHSQRSTASLNLILWSLVRSAATSVTSGSKGVIDTSHQWKG